MATIARTFFLSWKGINAFLQQTKGYLEIKNREKK